MLKYVAMSGLPECNPLEMTTYIGSQFPLKLVTEPPKCTPFTESLSVLSEMYAKELTPSGNEFLRMVARDSLIQKVVRPAVSNNHSVISHRCFLDDAVECKVLNNWEFDNWWHIFTASLTIKLLPSIIIFVKEKEDAVVKDFVRYKYNKIYESAIKYFLDIKIKTQIVKVEINMDLPMEERVLPILEVIK